MRVNSTVYERVHAVAGARRNVGDGHEGLVSVCVCVRACACVRVCVSVCVGGWASGSLIARSRHGRGAAPRRSLLPTRGWSETLYLFKKPAALV